MPSACDSTTLRNSERAGSCASLAMILSVSPSGRPARTPRTMMSRAAGSASMNFLMRRFLIRASTKLGHADARRDRHERREQRHCGT